MEKKFYALLSFIMLASCYKAHAQTNLAPSATATCNTTSGSTTTGGGWNWSQINNNTISGCGNQEAFIWTQSPPASSDEMTWTWTSAKSINKIIFYNAMTSNPGRTMTGCTVQYWNGSTWANWLVTANNALKEQCIDSLTFPTVTTTALRITAIKMVTSGQNSNPNWREIQIISGPSVNNDAGVSVISPFNICTYTQAISARAFNFGKFKLDSFRLHWSINNVLQTPRYITSSLGSAKDTLIVLNSAYTFTKNSIYTFKMWTSKPNGTVDSVGANDTQKYVLSFLGNPTPPTTNNYIQCGVGSPILSATPAVSTDSIAWYDASTGGKFLGIGKSIVGPYLTQSKTFYAQAIGISTQKSNLQTAPLNTVVTFSYVDWNGAFADVTPANNILLDSVTIRVYNNLPATKFRIYYKTGTYSGSQTNGSSWTLLFDGQANTSPARYFISNGEYYARVPAKILLNGSQTYGFYVTIDPTGAGNTIFLGNSVASNTDLSITVGVANIGLFGSVQYTGYTPNLNFQYTKTCANPTRTSLNVTVKPRPTGADVAKGSTFQGQFRQGNTFAPDITEAGKTIIYDLVPPTGFTSAGHGSTWLVNSIIAKTKYGVTVPATDYSVIAPSGTGPGTVTFIPKSIYIDSLITFSVRYSDLGPYFCDSTIKRTVVVAPTPRPNFKFPKSICLGDAVLFDNTTTIQSGNASYTWYFGNGDSSDLQSPVYEYKSPGMYTVKLIAKSFPWNVLHDTTITLEVGELPTTKFRANNKCEGLAVTFQNQTVVGNGALTYDWNFGDGSAHSTATNPSHLYAVPGGYKVTLKASANGCVSTLVKNAYMFARPVANFAAPLAPVCSKSVVTLPNTSTIALGEQGAYWTFGDGSGSTQYQGEHTYNSPATYSVKLLAVSEFDCKDSITKTVIIKAAPSPDFSGNQFCGKIPTVFTNKTLEALPNPVYNWTFSDNYTSSLKSVTRTWPYEGPFTATLKATYSNGCSGTVSKDFTVLIQPKADFTVEDVCSGETANFVNLSQGDRSGIEYNWDFGNSTTSSLAAPTKIYSPLSTTTYTVTMVASYPGACSDTTRKTITVSESPVCDFTFKDLGLLSVKFTPGNSTYSKYEWFFGEGGTSTSSAPNYQYKYSGNFKVTMHATNQAGCSCEITKRISATTSINPLSSMSNISIYPNPNNGLFTISNTEGKSMKIEIYSVLGSLVYTSESENSIVPVDLHLQSNGIYVVKVTIDGIVENHKITLNH